MTSSQSPVSRLRKTLVSGLRDASLSWRNLFSSSPSSTVSF